MPIWPYHSPSNSTSPICGKSRFSARLAQPCDGVAGVAQCPDTAEDEPAGLVHAEGGQDLLGIPGAFAAWQDGLAQIVASGTVAKLK